MIKFDTATTAPEPKYWDDTPITLVYHPEDGTETRRYETTLGAAWCYWFSGYEHLSSAYENYNDCGACWYEATPATDTACLAPYLQ